MRSKVYFIPASREDGHEVLAKKAEKVFLKVCLGKRIEQSSLVACKIHFGEKGNTGFVNPFWLLNIINRIKKKTSRVFLTDTNTLYTGLRSNSVDHLHLAWEHGFTQETLGAPVIIADGLVGRDDYESPVNLSRIESAKIASAFFNTDVLLCVSHFTGHVQTGFGAAIKNLGMGCASRAGKLEQHSDVHPWINPKVCNNCGICLNYCPCEAIDQKDGSTFIIEDKCIGCGECIVVCNNDAVKFRWDADSVRVQEKMAEYACSLCQLFKGKIGFINFLLKVTKNCDCMSKDEKAVLEDIGILSSIDPVAIDKASVDLVNKKDNKDLLREMNNADWTVQLRHGEKIGLGTTNYELIQIS